MFKSVKSKVILAAAIVVGIALVVLGVYLSSVNAYQDKVKQIVISDVDISGVPDGVYTGDCDVDYVYAKVQATVKDGKMTDLKLLEHRTDRGRPAESIIQTILSQQKVDVDSITGATNSSMVIKKAVENALLQQNK